MKRIVWMVMACLAVTAMVLAACGEEATTTPPPATTIPPTTTPPTTAPPTTTPPGLEKPKYGGITTISLAADILGFDEAFTAHNVVMTLHLTNEELLEGDWAKGPAGTNEATWVLGGINEMRLKTGALAESWEIPERGKMIFHIRQGVHYALNPSSAASKLVNGRELTVDDIVFSLKRMCTEPRAYIKMAYPTLAAQTVITGDATARTVTIECPVTEWANAVTLFPDFVSIMPPEVIKQYGNMNDWRNSCGTGPFILTDFVSNGSATVVRNPSYWKTNPVGPGKGDQLPYIDGAKLLIIPDLATRMTAMRTAKIDAVGGEWDDVEDIIQSNPKIQYMQYVADSCYNIAMRTDKAESPFSKKEVRQALHLATDFNKIKNEYYSGKAEILVWPLSNTKEYAAAYVPLDKLPANVQELYSHNTTKAKQLLTTAGYPTGFKATIICYNTPTQTDYLAMIQSMWAEVGITLNINALDYAVWMARLQTRTYDELIYAYTSGAWNKWINFNGASQYNSSYVNDARVKEVWPEMQAAIGFDESKTYKLNADLMPYVLEQCWVHAKPNPYLYVIWWPWLKNYHGELQVGYYNYPGALKYRWQDLDLKEEMTGRR